MPTSEQVLKDVMKAFDSDSVPEIGSFYFNKQRNTANGETDADKWQHQMRLLYLSRWNELLKKEKSV